MDALGLLTADHNRVRGLFARFRSAQESSDTSSLMTLADTILQELDVHTTIEEKVFYPAVRGLEDEIKENVDEGLEEHHVVKVLMGEIRNLAPTSDRWVAKMTVVIENVEHHAEEEEGELFPAVRKAMSADALDDLGSKLEAKKAELGAPTLADTLELTKDDLMELAREQEIPGRSSMSKEELAATVAPR